SLSITPLNHSQPSFPTRRSSDLENTLDSLKEIFLKDIESLFPVILNKLAGNLAQEVHLKAMVTERLSNLPISRLEKAAFPVLGHFQAAAAIGGLLGGIAILLLS